MKDLQTAVAAWLEERTGVTAVCGRSPVRGKYPLFAVGVEQKSVTLLAGGQLAEHTWQVEITAVSDREREGVTALLATLPPLLLGGIPLVRSGEARTLHPLHIKTEGERLTFRVELCEAVVDQSSGGSGPEAMQTLHFGV